MQPKCRPAKKGTYTGWGRHGAWLSRLSAESAPSIHTHKNTLIAIFNNHKNSCAQWVAAQMRCQKIMIIKLNLSVLSVCF